MTGGDAGGTAEMVPLPLRVRGCEGAVIGVDVQIVFLEFGVCAGICGVEALAVQFGPIGD